MSAGLLGAAREQFVGAGLTFPSLPPHLGERLAQRSEWHFSTRDDDIWPYVLSDFLDEFEREAVADYAVVAHAGHGSASWALSYFVVTNGVGTFVQTAWGSSYDDDDALAAASRRFTTRCEQVTALREAAAARDLGPGQRLGAAASDLRGERWVHWDLGETPTWKPAGDALAAATDWVRSPS